MGCANIEEFGPETLNETPLGRRITYNSKHQFLNNYLSPDIMNQYNETSDNDTNQLDINQSRKIHYFIDFETFNNEALVERAEFFFRLKFFAGTLSIDDLTRFEPLSTINETNEFINELVFENFISYLCAEAELKKPDHQTILKIFLDLKPTGQGLYRNQLLTYYLRISTLLAETALFELQKRSILYFSLAVINIKNLETKHLTNLISIIEDKQKLLNILDLNTSVIVSTENSIEFITKFIEDKFQIRVLKNIESIFEEHLRPLILFQNNNLSGNNKNNSGEITNESLIAFLKYFSQELLSELKKEIITRS